MTQSVHVSIYIYIHTYGAYLIVGVAFVHMWHCFRAPGCRAATMSWRPRLVVSGLKVSRPLSPHEPLT